MVPVVSVTNFDPNSGPVSGLPVGAAQLELVHAAEGANEPVRGCQLGIEEELVGVPVRAAAVGPHACREQQPPVGQEHFLLPEDAQVPDRLEPRGHGLAGRLLRALLSRQERAPQNLGGVQPALLVLDPAGGGQLGPLIRRRRIIGVTQIECGVQVPVRRFARPPPFPAGHRHPRTGAREERPDCCPAGNSPPRRYR